jgi:hypothetical protein
VLFTNAGALLAHCQKKYGKDLELDRALVPMRTVITIQKGVVADSEKY